MRQRKTVDTVEMKLHIPRILHEALKEEYKGWCDADKYPVRPGLRNYAVCKMFKNLDPITLEENGQSDEKDS